MLAGFTRNINPDEEHCICLNIPHALVWHFESRWYLAEDQVKQGPASPLERSAAGNPRARNLKCHRPPVHGIFTG